MAQLQPMPAEESKTKRRVHRFPQIDMTPMVDLGFLLITFFIFTTSMTEKTTMKLVMPAEGPVTPVRESRSLTILLASNDRTFVYEGMWQDAIQRNAISVADYSSTGVRKIIMLKQKQLKKADSLIVVIKPLDQCSYKNTVDILDEMVINGVTRYAITQPTEEEKNYVMRME
ncbi:MAG: ExbD/TolR family protein [Flavisolibacter sp.]